MDQHNEYPEGSVPFLLGEIKAEQKATNEKLDKLLKSDEDFESRITALEHDKMKTLGFTGAISLVASAVWAWLMNR